MSVLVPFTGPLVSAETTSDLLTDGTSCETSDPHFGLPMELCAFAITSSWQMMCTFTSDPMAVLESVFTDQHGCLIKRAHENNSLVVPRSGDTQDRYLCRVLRPSMGC